MTNEKRSAICGTLFALFSVRREYGNEHARGAIHFFRCAWDA